MPSGEEGGQHSLQVTRPFVRALDARWQTPSKRPRLPFPAPFGPTTTVSLGSRSRLKLSNDNAPSARTEVMRMTRSLHLAGILSAGSTMQTRSDTDPGMTDHDPLPFCSQNR